MPNNTTPTPPMTHADYCKKWRQDHADSYYASRLRSARRFLERNGYTVTLSTTGGRTDDPNEQH